MSLGRLITSRRVHFYHKLTSRTFSHSIPPSPKLSLFQKQIQTFKTKPASYLTSFLILHEITAIAPLPLVYYTLTFLEWDIENFDPTGYIKEGNEFINKLRKRYPWIGPDWGMKEIAYATASYAIIKAILPLRIAISIWGTPWFASRIISPIFRLFRRSKT